MILQASGSLEEIERKKKKISSFLLKQTTTTRKKKKLVSVARVLPLRRFPSFRSPPSIAIAWAHDALLRLALDQEPRDPPS